MKNKAELICNYAGESKVVVLEGRQTLGRPSKKSNPDIALPVRSVSRIHGEFITDDDTWLYKDMGGTNGTVYNGKMLEAGAIRVLKDGDTLRIHGAEDPERVMDVEMIFREVGDEEIPETEKSVFGWDNRMNAYAEAAGRSTKARHPGEHPGHRWGHRWGQAPVVAETGHPGGLAPMVAGLEVHIQDRSVGRRGKQFAILRDINFSIPNGSMVLILGGSGAGKTTLVNAIMGYEKANGTILYNDTDIYKEYEKMKYEIGYVPQQDLLRMTDTVYDTLLNAAYMRLPSGQAEQFYIDKALTTMEMLGLKREKDSMIKKLSGGQRKRLSIAVEYVGNPSLFFLDEPDSGLDGIMARELMNNLRTIADEGKIVIVITHSPDRAFELFDSVVVLAKDMRDNCGHLVFQGHPKEACRFFEAKDFESIVRKINREDEGGEWLAEHFIEKYEGMTGQ